MTIDMKILDRVRVFLGSPNASESSQLPVSTGMHCQAEVDDLDAVVSSPNPLFLFSYFSFTSSFVKSFLFSFIFIPFVSFSSNFLLLPFSSSLLLFFRPPSVFYFIFMGVPCTMSFSCPLRLRPLWGCVGLYVPALPSSTGLCFPTPHIYLVSRYSL